MGNMANCEPDEDQVTHSQKGLTPDRHKSTAKFGWKLPVGPSGAIRRQMAE